MRDLTVEGIEPNPGPSWSALLSKLKELYPENYSDIHNDLTEFEKNIKLALKTKVVTTAEVEDFFRDDKLVAKYPLDRGVTSIIKEGLAKLKESSGLSTGILSFII